MFIQGEFFSCFFVRKSFGRPRLSLIKGRCGQTQAIAVSLLVLLFVGCGEGIAQGVQNSPERTDPIAEEVQITERQSIDLSKCLDRNGEKTAVVRDFSSLVSRGAGAEIGFAFLGRSGSVENGDSIKLNPNEASHAAFFEFGWTYYPAVVHKRPNEVDFSYRALIAAKRPGDAAATLYPSCHSFEDKKRFSEQTSVLPKPAHLSDLILWADSRIPNTQYLYEYINGSEQSADSYTFILVKWFAHSRGGFQFLESSLSTDLETWWRHAQTVVARRTEPLKAPWLCHALEDALGALAEDLDCPSPGDDAAFAGDAASQFYAADDGHDLSNLEFEMQLNSQLKPRLNYEFGWNAARDLQTIVGYTSKNLGIDQHLYVPKSKSRIDGSGKTWYVEQDPPRDLKQLDDLFTDRIHKGDFPPTNPNRVARSDVEAIRSTNDPIADKIAADRASNAGLSPEAKIGDERLGQQNCGPGQISPGCAAVSVEAATNVQAGAVARNPDVKQVQNELNSLPQNLNRANVEPVATAGVDKPAADSGESTGEIDTTPDSADDYPRASQPVIYPVEFIFENQGDWIGTGAVPFASTEECLSVLEQGGRGLATREITRNPVDLKLSDMAAVAVLRQSEVIVPCQPGRLTDDGETDTRLVFELKLFAPKGPPLVFAISPAIGFYDRRMEAQVKSAVADWINSLFDSGDPPVVRVVVIDGNRNVSVILNTENMAVLAHAQTEDRRRKLSGMLGHFSFAVRSMQPVRDARVLYELSEGEGIRHFIYLVDSTREPFYVEDLGPVYALLLRQKVSITVVSLGSCRGWNDWFSGLQLTCFEIKGNGQNLTSILASVTAAKSQ